MAGGGRGRWQRATRVAVRIAPGAILAVGGALVGTFNSAGLWVAAVGVVLVVGALVWDLRQADRRARRGARPQLPGDPGRLPPEPTRFVGTGHLRIARELQEALARPGTYLVTGPVGSGKSTVCAQALNTIAVRRMFLHTVDGHEAEDRRFWADLDGRRPGAEVEDAVAHALGVDSLPAALAVLGDAAPTLLVLDGADEALVPVGDGDPVLRRLAAAGGGLRLLVTARARPSLGGVERSRVWETSTLSAEAANQLFAALAPGYADREAVAVLLRATDGLPQAVSTVGHVAAATDRPADFADLAARALRGLGDQAEGRALRLAVTLAASALDEEEQAAWRALSVFPAGLGRDDLRPVLGMPLADYHVAHLRSLGLVARAGAGLRIPQPLRLPADPDDDHAAVWARFVARGLEVVRSGADVGPWLGRHAYNLASLAERNPLPAGSLELACEALVVERPLRHADLAEKALVEVATSAMVDARAAARLRDVADQLRDRYHLIAAAAALRAVVKFESQVGNCPALAGALLVSGSVALFDGRSDDAERLLDDAQSIYDEIDDLLGGANARQYRGDLALATGRDDDAERLLADAQSIYDDISNRLGGANALKSRGDVARARGRYDDAERLLADAQSVYDEIGDLLGGANARRSRGEVARARGRYDDAERLLADAQAIYDGVGDRTGGANARQFRGDLARTRGRYEDAERLLADAQSICDDIGEPLGGANARLSRGRVALARGQLAEAERLLTDAQELYDHMGEPLGRANTRESRGRLALGMVESGAAPSSHLAVGRRWHLEAEAIFGQIGDLAWQGRALAGAARCSDGDERTRLAMRAAATLERAGLLTEARALEPEFGVIVSIGAVVEGDPPHAGT